MAAKRKANGGNGEAPKTPTSTPRKSSLRPPWKPGECPNPKGRPKGSLGIKARLRRALEEPSRQGEKPPIEKAVGGIARKAARSPDFALKALDYLDPRTNIVEATSDVSLRATSDRFIPKAEDQAAFEELLRHDEVLH